MTCGVDHRRGSDPTLLWLWLWCRPAATAAIRPLAWEPPYTMGAALKRHKTKKKVQEKSPKGTTNKIDRTSLLDPVFKKELRKC